MAAQTSAGLLMCRWKEGELEFLLAHPGGPFFARKDEGAWTIPKGLVQPGEQPLAAARREFTEETGIAIDTDAFVDLGRIRQKGGKEVRAWAFLGDCDPDALCSNTFELEWPARSGRRQTFPEIDRIEFFDLDRAQRKILAAQISLLLRAAEAFASSRG